MYADGKPHLLHVDYLSLSIYFIFKSLNTIITGCFSASHKDNKDKSSVEFILWGSWESQGEMTSMFCLFSSPSWKHTGRETIPKRQVWAPPQLWPRASFVSLGCSGYALEWIRTTWSKTTVELGGIFSQECGLRACGEVDTGDCDKVRLMHTL